MSLWWAASRMVTTSVLPGRGMSELSARPSKMRLGPPRWISHRRALFFETSRMIASKCIFATGAELRPARRNVNGSVCRPASTVTSAICTVSPRRVAPPSRRLSGGGRPRPPRARRPRDSRQVPALLVFHAVVIIRLKLAANPLLIAGSSGFTRMISSNTSPRAETSDGGTICQRKNAPCPHCL